MDEILGELRELRRVIEYLRVEHVHSQPKIQPEHNHQIGEIPGEVCKLCGTHGDVWDPKLPECHFEGDEVTFESC